MSQTQKEMLSEFEQELKEARVGDSIQIPNGLCYPELLKLLKSIRPHGVEFQKYDSGKARYSLIPSFAEEEMAKVLTFGAEKYDADNWRKVDDPKRYLDAAMRHIAAYRKGDALDEESGLHHLAHAMCCLAFIVDLEKQNES